MKFILLVASIVFGIPVANASKCKVERGQFFENIDSASFIALGTIESISPTEGSYSKIAKMKVKDTLKSSNKNSKDKTISFFYFEHKVPGCKAVSDQLFLKENERYLVFLRNEEGKLFSSHRVGGALLEYTAVTNGIPEIIKKYLTGTKSEILSKDLPKFISP